MFGSSAGNEPLYNMGFSSTSVAQRQTSLFSYVYHPSFIPIVSWSILLEDQHDVSYVEVILSIVPLSSFLMIL